MKRLTLTVVVLALVTMTIIPKADAKSLLNTQQILLSQVPNSSKNTNDGEIYFRRGFDRLLKKNDYQGAIEDFTQFLKIYPNNSDAYLGRGTSYFYLKSYQSAKSDFDKALENNPENVRIPHILQLRGICRFELKDKPGAIADLQKASALFKEVGDQESAQQVDTRIKKIQES